MQIVTNKEIMELNPCYDPIKKGYFKKNWSGSVIDFLECKNFIKEIPIFDKFWVVLRPEFIDEKTLRLFAVWCAREALKFVKNPNEKSIKACDVAEKYANGQATSEELNIARSAARSAAWSAAEDTERSAAESAAWSATWSATRSAAWSAAESATRSAAWSAAESATRSAQLKQLIKILKEETKCK